MTIDFNESYSNSSFDSIASSPVARSANDVARELIARSILINICNTVNNIKNLTNNNSIFYIKK